MSRSVVKGFRRRLMNEYSNKTKFLVFKDLEVWRICCINWGDFIEEIVIDNGDNTVNITTNYVSMKKTTRSKVLPISVQTNVDNTGGEYVAGTTKTPVGITLDQCTAVTSMETQFKRNTTIVDTTDIMYFSNVTSAGNQFYQNCSNLEVAIYPLKVTSYVNAFNGCPKLVHIDIRSVTNLANGQLQSLSNLKTIRVDKVKTIGGNTTGTYGVFSGCSSLDNLVFTALTYIKNAFLRNCNAMRYVIISAEAVPTFTGSFGGNNCPIYVPDDIIEDYKIATTWSNYATRFHKLSEFSTDFPNEEDYVYELINSN